MEILLILIHLRRRRALNMIDTSQYLKGASPYDQAYVLNYGDGDYSLEAVRTSVPSSSDDIQHTVRLCRILLIGIMGILVNGF